MEKQLGFMTAFSLVAGIVIGSGILVLPSIVAQYGNLGFWAWPAASIAVLNLAFMFGHLSRKHPRASGLAGYIKQYFGDFAGFQSAWACAIGMCMGLAIVAISFTGYFSSIFGVTDSIWLALAALWSVLILQIFSTIVSTGALIAITVFKIVAIGSIAIFGLGHLDTAIFSAPSLAKSGTGGLIEAIALVLFTFIGIESATLPGGNIKNSERVIPMVTILGTALAASLFTFTYWAVWSVVPTQQLIASSAPVADAAAVILGPIGHKMIAAFAVIGCLGSLNGCLLCAGHVIRSSAAERWLPASFAQTSRTGFPVAGALLSAVITTAAIVFYYNAPASMMPMIRQNIAQLEVFLVAIVYLTSCMAYRLAGGRSFMFWFGFACCALFVYGSMDSRTSAVIGVMSFLSSIPVYALCKRS